jgi:surface antigen
VDAVLCLALNGKLTFHSYMDRLGADEERFVLLAMHQALLETHTAGARVRWHWRVGADRMPQLSPAVPGPGGDINLS